MSKTEPIPLTEWLENQKQRAEDHIHDDRVGEAETQRWRGERQLIHAIQEYIRIGVVEVE